MEDKMNSQGKMMDAVNIELDKNKTI